ncbi:hypothetical protein [Endozoicomonas atrinae]|uniref:hypothetical protein n=1 Tax=Endozoicomonas atrinae TaxID=1333660 RepID=UPI000826B516|nr:hypothetical protein [Endozoicomonas atrinae]
MTAPTSGMTASGTPESQWTHVKLFNKVKDGVSGLFGEGKIASKIGGFFGWTVAILTSPGTLLGGLVYDGGQKIKSLLSRDAKKVESVEKKVPTQAQFEALQNKLTAAEAAAKDAAKKAELEKANLRNEAESQIDALVRNAANDDKDIKSKVGCIRKQQLEIEAQQEKIDSLRGVVHSNIAKIGQLKGDLKAFQDVAYHHMYNASDLAAEVADLEAEVAELKEEADRLQELWLYERSKTVQDKLEEERVRFEERMARFEQRLAQIARTRSESEIQPAGPGGLPVVTDSLPVATDSLPARPKMHFTLRMRESGTGHRSEGLPVQHRSAHPGMNNGPIDVDAELHSSRVQAELRGLRMESLRQRLDLLEEISEAGDLEGDQRPVVSDQLSTMHTTVRDRVGSYLREDRIADESQLRFRASNISRQADSVAPLSREGSSSGLEVTTPDLEDIEVDASPLVQTDVLGKTYPADSRAGMDVYRATPARVVPSLPLSDIEDSVEDESMPRRPLTRHTSLLTDRRRASFESDISFKRDVVEVTHADLEDSETLSPRPPIGHIPLQSYGNLRDLELDSESKDGLEDLLSPSNTNRIF